MTIGRGVVLGLLLAAAQEPKRLYQPEDVARPPWLEERRQAQLRTAAGIDVFHDFRFHDRVDESGITFRNRVTDDSTRHYKAIHYDHGNGVSIADVDSDGKLDLSRPSAASPSSAFRGRQGRRRTRPECATPDTYSCSSREAKLRSRGRQPSDASHSAGPPASRGQRRRWFARAAGRRRGPVTHRWEQAAGRCREGRRSAEL